MSSVVKKALLSFGVALAVGWAVVWFAMDWIIANKDSLIATLQGQLATLQHQQGAKPNEARDPDTIYQDGRPVGKVVAPEAHLAEGYWTFSRIMADGTFNGSRDFEYRDHRLKILSAESAGRIGSGANPAAELCKCNGNCIGSAMTAVIAGSFRGYPPC